MRLIDKTGNRYGYLTVISYDRTKRKWKCKCDCGNNSFVNSDNLSRGKQISCGCYNKQRLGKATAKHRKSYTRLYYVWRNMITRVNNPNCKSHKYYKDVGICSEWGEFEPFEEWAFSVGYQDNKGLQLDRINPKIGYHPFNCQFLNGVDHGKKTQRDKRRRQLRRMQLQ